MKGERSPHQLRDARPSRGWYWIHDHLTRRWARHVGAYAVAVYAAICSRAGPCRRSWPGLELLATESGCSVPTVKRSIIKLLAFGLLRREARYQVQGRPLDRSYLYTITDIERLPWPPLSGLGGDPTDPLSDDKRAPQGSPPGDPRDPLEGIPGGGEGSPRKDPQEDPQGGHQLKKWQAEELTSAWLRRCTRRRGGRPAHVRGDIQPIMLDLLEHGWTYHQLQRQVEDPARLVSETIGQWQHRVARGPRVTVIAETVEERRARVAELRRRAQEERLKNMPATVPVKEALARLRELRDRTARPEPGANGAPEKTRKER